jgi:caffeoyl-CoA O-methyltransferase
VIIDPDIDSYISGLLPARDGVLSEMEVLAARNRIPIIGPQVANFLALLVRISGAKRIFELGSAIGYSTVWLARAAGAGAEIHYSDGSPDNARLARGFFERAGVASRIEMHVGDALTALAGTPGEFDLLFNDVDKEGYPAVLEAAPPRLKRGGLFITDNTLWHGRVLDPQRDSDRAVATFNQRLKQSADFACASLLPVRDGVSVCIRV